MFHADETERNYNLFHKIYYNVEAVNIEIKTPIQFAVKDWQYYLASK